MKIEKAESLHIDFAWHSLKSDLNLEINAFTFGVDGSIIPRAHGDGKE